MAQARFKGRNGMGRTPAQAPQDGARCVPINLNPGVGYSLHGASRNSIVTSPCEERDLTRS